MSTVTDETGITNSFLGGFVEQVINPEAFEMVLAPVSAAVDVTWDAQENALFYRVYCGSNPQTLRLVADSVLETAFHVGGLTGGSQYFFQVTAVLTPRASLSSLRKRAFVSAVSAPTVTLTADPTSIFLGDSTTLTWSSTNATALTASGAWSGSKTLSGTEIQTPDSTGDFGYDLSAVGPGGSALAGVVVHVALDTCPALVDSIFGDGTSISLPVLQALTSISFMATRDPPGSGNGAETYEVAIDATQPCAYRTGEVSSDTVP